MSRLPRALAMTAAVILILSSGAHSLLGWPSLRAKLAEANVQPALISGLAMGWHFAGIAMLVLGLLVLWLLAESRRRGAGVALPLGVIGGAYVLFAIGCATLIGWDPFLLTFLVPGALLSIAAALTRRQPVLATA
jgi:hypothetical protein